MASESLCARHKSVEMVRKRGHGLTSDEEDERFERGFILNPRKLFFFFPFMDPLETVGLIRASCYLRSARPTSFKSDMGEGEQT